MSPILPEIARRVPWGLIGTLTLVAAFESFIAGDDLRFSRTEPDDWNQAGRAARLGTQSGGVLFFGDSQVKFGFSPLTIESKLGQPSQSLAIIGGQPPSSYFLLRRALGSGAMPSAVVVDFEPHLLRDTVDQGPRMWAELADLGEIAELSREAGDPDAFASMALGRALPSYRRRLEVRGNLMAAFRGETPAMAAAIETGRRNRGMNRGATVLTRDGREAHDISRWGNPSPKPWDPSPINQRYARKFLELARDRHIPVYCALMPIDPSLLSKQMASGMEGRYRGWLAWLQGQYPNLYVLDWRDANYRPSSFMDALHLNADGVASISVALGDYLKRSARGEGVDVRWVKMPDYKVDGTEVAVEDYNTSDLIMKSTAATRRR